MSLTTIATVETDGAQGALEIVHAKMFVPKPKPVTEVVGDNELVIVPLPEIKVQAPVPVTAALPFIIVDGDEIQRVWLVPAFAVVGTPLTVTATVEEDAEQGGFEIVHWKIFTPVPSPVIDEFGEREFVIVPLPEIRVHAPVPTVALFAAIVVTGLFAHNV